MSTEKPQSAPQIHIQAARGIAQLQARKKAIMKEHRERIKRLGKLMALIETESAKRPGELFDLPASYDPDLIALCQNPLRGL